MSISSLPFQFQVLLECANRYFDLSFRRFSRRQPLEPEPGLDDRSDAPILPFFIREADHLVSKTRNEGDEDHPGGHFVSEGKVMGEKGKDEDADHHHHEQKVRPASGME